MHRFQYYKVASCTPDVFIGDPDANKKEILNIIHSLDSDTQLAVFPELCISGYTCQDLFYEDILSVTPFVRRCLSQSHCPTLIWVSHP